MISGPGDDGSPTFSPDGETLFFTRSAARWSVILESHKAHGAWSAEDAEHDYKRVQDWDNGNTKVWSISLEQVVIDDRS